MPLILVLLGMLAALGYWLIKHPKFWSNFVAKSIFSRLHIWQSVLNGAFDALPFGHGFGTFAIDFPVYRQHADVLGGHMAEHVAHAHNVLLHFFFEQGLLGIALYLFLLVLIFTKSRAAFLPFLVISVCDASLVSFNQYLLAALILVPSINVTDVTFMRYPLVRKILGTLASALIKPACYLACTLALIFSTLSVTAHYHYDRGNFSKAITLDPYHSLYHFMRGASNLHLLAGNSETDLKRAVELSPHVSYFYGFLAAAHLANAQDLSPNSEDPRLKLASEAINKAIQCDGNDAYWHTLSSFIHYQNPELSKREMQLALKRNPEIEALLKDPSQAASEYIGSRKSDVRISGFYRRGPKVYLPLPYLE